jgi:Domain of unknown function (DUF4234)
MFCHNCGEDLSKIVPEDSPISTDVENVQKYSRIRKFTDTNISPWWLIVPAVSVLAYLGTSFYNISSFFAVFNSPVAARSSNPFPFLNFSAVSLVTLIPEIIFLYLFYTLIKRRNLHFERQNRLFRTLNAALRKIAFAKGVSGIERYTTYVDTSLYSSAGLEQEKSAAFWAILLIIPLVNVIAFIYILHFLNEDFHFHEQRENYVLSVFGYELQMMGFVFSFKREYPVPSRNFVLYLVLTIVTLGLFSIYWDYILIKDPNGHFADQAKIEDTLLERIMPLLTV